MIKLEELKQRFPIQNVPPYGECIVVPGDEFDPDWEGFLDEQGYGCVFTDVNRKPVTLVLTIKRHGESTKTVYEPRGEPQKVSVKSAMKGPQWGLKDEQHLIERVNELKGSLEGKIRILAKEFQGRSPNAILQKYHKLVKAGLPRPVKSGRPRKAVSPDLQKEMDKALENVCPDCGLPKDLCYCDEEKKESLRREIQTPEEEIQKGSRGHAQKSPIEASPRGVVCFETYCRKCRTRRTVEDYDVWRACPICLEPLIVWNVQETE